MSEIITFYSYKGGVGRTMALANVSVMLARWGHKVLVVDWDLEAPGLEHFYKDYLQDINIVSSTPGIVDLLQFENSFSWKDCLIPVQLPQAELPVHLITSGKRDEGYFKKVREFNVDAFYEQNGGAVVEQLRNEWLENYDYILVDSRTGITEIGGICTIQLPDTVVMLFTATHHGFGGVLDIIKRAGAAQQKLPYDRRRLAFLPVPSKFETNTEFKLSQEWLEKFSRELEATYNDWLPLSINKKDFLELTKVPYAAYFSFGEKLPVIEQGVKDPAGLGYAYETLAAIIGHRLGNMEELVNNREQYILAINKYPMQENEVRKHLPSDATKRIKTMQQSLNIKADKLEVLKSYEAIIHNLENGILDLLQTLSEKLRTVAGLYKNYTESFIVVGKYYDSLVDDWFGIESHASLSNLTSTILDFKNKYREIGSLKCRFTFNGIRNSTFENKITLSFDLIFHEAVYEIKSDFGNVTIDKLYHQMLTVDEINFITDAITNAIIEETENTMLTGQ
jgi:MinD-like ATPase involved in chromosome partitioning or flagellar assembly